MNTKVFFDTIYATLEKKIKSKVEKIKKAIQYPCLFFIFFIMSMLKEFKEFAMKGNVIDLAVGVVIGTAFGKIVTSLVEDIIMPIIGKITGGLDFSNIYYTFGNASIAAGTTLADAKKAWAILAYGNFLTVTLNFLIIAFCIFLVIHSMNKTLKKKKPEAAPAGPTDVELLSEIRDLLKKKA